MENIWTFVPRKGGSTGPMITDFTAVRQVVWLSLVVVDTCVGSYMYICVYCLKHLSMM